MISCSSLSQTSNIIVKLVNVNFQHVFDRSDDLQAYLLKGLHHLFDNYVLRVNNEGSITMLFHMFLTSNKQCSYVIIPIGMIQTNDMQYICRIPGSQRSCQQKYQKQMLSLFKVGIEKIFRNLLVQKIFRKYWFCYCIVILHFKQFLEYILRLILSHVFPVGFIYALLQHLFRFTDSNIKTISVELLLLSLLLSLSW